MEVLFLLSSEIQKNVMVKINGVIGLPPVDILEQQVSKYYSPCIFSEEYELYVEVELYQKGMRLGLPVSSEYKIFSNHSKCEWNTWLELPVQFCDISRDAQLVFTVWKLSPVNNTYNERLSKRGIEISTYLQKNADWTRLKAKPVGGVTLPLFEGRVLRYGRHKLRLAEGIRGDGSIDSRTHFWKLNPHLTVKDRLETVLTKKLMRPIKPVPWLDSLTNRRITKATGIQLNNRNISHNQKLYQQYHHNILSHDTSPGIYLFVSLPNFGHSVVYQERAKGYRPPKLYKPRHLSSHSHVSPRNRNDDKKENELLSSNHSSNHDSRLYSKSSREQYLVAPIAPTSNETHLLVLHDPEINRSNPVREKDKRLEKHTEDGDLKPSKEENNKLLKIINSPSRVLSEKDMKLIWKFRNSLINNKKALTKFLRSVTQSNEDQVKIAIELINKWERIEPHAALELLSGEFEVPEFRKFGIDVLKSASDNDLEEYIMQLVQAIRFEESHEADLNKFLIDRALNSDDFRLLNFLYWCVEVQTYSEDEQEANLYEKYKEDLVTKCKKRRPKFWKEIERQNWLVKELIELSRIIDEFKGKADDKKVKLRSLLNTHIRWKKLQKFDEPVRIPVRPEISVEGIVPSKCSVFKSAQCPLLVTFTRAKVDNERRQSFLRRGTYFEELKKGELTPLSSKEKEKFGSREEINFGREGKNSLDTNTLYGTDKTFRSDSSLSNNSSSDESSQIEEDETPPYYKIIWKNGDDLRQDQLIIQMIRVMDNHLKKVNLDLCLTPYPVLATGLDHGMLEFVENSMAIAAILKDYNGDLLTFLSTRSGKTKHVQKVVDTFVRSCAGYCVITFLLGVGDRHLDNLLMTRNGRLFHIDFGFIYGDDPKPWPPPMKICKPMIEAMGGYNSGYYKQFQEHMSSCYNLLRKSSNLILNLLSLMGQGDNNEINKNLNYVYSKFRLELNDEQAGAYLLGLVEESVNALFTKVVDKIHDWATYWR